MDQNEFTAFYHETAASVRGYIRRVSGEGEAADDLLQETYLRFLRAHPATEDRAAMKAYLYKTATAAIYDRWRKQRHERLWSLAFRFREEAPAAGTGDVTRCFQKLKPKERALLWLALRGGVCAQRNRGDAGPEREECEGAAVPGTPQSGAHSAAEWS